MSQTNNEEAAKRAPVQDFYEVQEILDKRLTSNGLMYQIKWKNYPNEKDYTWEPIHHLVEVEDLVKQFNKKFDEKKKAVRKQKKEEKFNKKRKKSSHALKKNSSEQSQVDHSLPKKSSQKSKEEEKIGYQSNKKEDDSQIISHESQVGEEDSPIDQNTIRTKRLNNFETFSTEKEVQKNYSQLNQYLKTNNVKLGRIHQHFIQDDCLYFHVDIVRNSLIYAGTFLKLQELKQSHYEELISYMQSWTIHDLNNKILLQSDQMKQTIEYWRQKV